MSISGETIGQQTAKTYEEALNGNAVTALQIGTGKGKLPVSQIAPACIETTDVTQLSFSDIKFALDTGRTIVCATNWGHAAFHVHNDLLVEGQPDVYRLTADVGGKTLMYTMTTSDGGDTCTWSTLKVMPTIGSEIEESDSYIVCQLYDGVWKNGWWYDQTLDATKRHNMETGHWTSLEGETLQSYFKIKAGHVYQVNWSMSVSVATTYPDTIVQGRVFFTGASRTRNAHNFEVDFSRQSYNTINGSLLTVGDGEWFSYNVEMYRHDEGFIMPTIYFNDFSIVDVTSKVLGQETYVLDYRGSQYVEAADVLEHFENPHGEMGYYRNCRSSFINDTENYAVVQPISSMRQLESGDTIFGRTLDKTAVASSRPLGRG